ncbi:MAG: PIG-L family deacetylase [Chloroflexi bacterium]|nr:PIG-L family deacetylase [Chloroflexota bacterium]
MPVLLAIIPHPDDETYSFAGTIALAARAGWDCLIASATAGEAGKRHGGGPPGPFAVRDARERELAHSALVLGAKPPFFLGLPDGDLRHCEGGPELVQKLIRRVQPDLVLSLGADGAYGHPDHVVLHGWVRQAWESLPAPRPALLFAAFPPGLFLAQYEKCIDMMGVPPRPARAEIGAAPWHYEVDIRATAPVKLAAVAAHRTQLPGGDPETLFPPGIVAALLETERFTDARGARDAQLAAVLASLETA